MRRRFKRITKDTKREVFKQIDNLNEKMKEVLAKRKQGSKFVTAKEPAKYVLRFGTHSGKPLSEIPVAYLDWLLGEKEFGSPWERELAAVIRRHLQEDRKDEWDALDDEQDTDAFMGYARDD